MIDDFHRFQFRLLMLYTKMSSTIILCLWLDGWWYQKIILPVVKESKTRNLLKYRFQIVDIFEFEKEFSDEVS